MSISLTIYDVFGNLVPGILYLYVINEALIAFNQSRIDYSQLDKVPNLILVGVAAYVLGHLINSFTYDHWYRLFVNRYMGKEALDRLKNQHKDVAILFKPSDSQILFGVIRHHSPDLARTIEIVRASSIMLRNISLGAAMFTVLQIGLMIGNHTWETYLLMAGLGLAVFAMALTRGKQYDRWFYRDIFCEALNYGTTLDEVLEVSRKITAGEANRTKKAKNEKEVEFE